MISTKPELPSRLSAVPLGAMNLPGLRRFHRDPRWKEIPSSDDDRAGFLPDGVLLALYLVNEPVAEAATALPSPAAWSGVMLSCNVDCHQHVDAAFSAAVAAGATAVADPVDRPWDGRSAYVADPEDNRWEIAWASRARFDDRGALTGSGS